MCPGAVPFLRLVAVPSQCHPSLSRVPTDIAAPRASEAILCEDVGAIGQVERRPCILGTQTEGVDIGRRGCDPVEVI